MSKYDDWMIESEKVVQRLESLLKKNAILLGFNALFFSLGLYLTVTA